MTRSTSGASAPNKAKSTDQLLTNGEERIAQLQRELAALTVAISSLELQNRIDKALETNSHSKPASREHKPKVESRTGWIRLTLKERKIIHAGVFGRWVNRVLKSLIERH
jgi:hypothetical protein